MWPQTRWLLRQFYRAHARTSSNKNRIRFNYNKIQLMGTDRAAKSPNPRIHFKTEKQRLYFRRINILQKSTKKRWTDIIENARKCTFVLINYVNFILFLNEKPGRPTNCNFAHVRILPKRTSLLAWLALGLASAFHLRDQRDPPSSLPPQPSSRLAIDFSQPRHQLAPES